MIFHIIDIRILVRPRHLQSYTIYESLPSGCVWNHWRSRGKPQ